MLRNVARQLLMTINKETFVREVYYKYVFRPRGIYTAINDRFRFIFVHIPKTGGLSLLYSLFNEERLLGHRSILQYKYANIRKFHEFFKFTIVRNPWNRFASSYFFLSMGGITEGDKKWGEENLSQFSDLEEFVLSLKNKRNAMRILSSTHFRHQSYYIVDSHKTMLLDFIVRFEEYEKGYCILKKRFGIDKSLAHINAGSHTGDYDELFSPEMRRVVGDLYDADIKLLGYETSY